MTHLDFLTEQAEKLFAGEENMDRLICPDCGGVMPFYGAGRVYGQGYWQCSGCAFSFTEEALERIEIDKSWI